MENYDSSIKPKGLKTTPSFYISIFAVSLMVLFLRNPAAFIHPQFWAEDGKVWYAEAYNQGPVLTLFKYHIDYFQTISRMAASLAQAVPLALAPLVFILVSAVIQALPVLFLFSKRFEKLMPNFYVKILLAAIYLLLPNTAEARISLTYAQWFLAILACMIIFGDAAKNLKQKIFDFAVLVLAGLSGPYIIFLSPIAFLQWLKFKDKWRLVLFAVAVCCSFIQIAFIALLSHGGRVYPQLGVNLRLFFAILNRQVFVAAIIGQRGYLWVAGHVAWQLWLFAATTILGLLLTAYALWKAGFEQKLFIIFGLLIFCASLFSPSVSDFSKPAWKVLYLANTGIRYWLIPMLAFVTILFFNAKKGTPIFLRSASILLLATMIIGIVADFNQNIYVDMHFSQYVQTFKTAPDGAKITIPINPPGWSMELIKH